VSSRCLQPCVPAGFCQIAAFRCHASECRKPSQAIRNGSLIAQLAMRDQSQFNSLACFAPCPLGVLEQLIVIAAGIFRRSA
jgi:hypothetical protein